MNGGIKRKQKKVAREGENKREGDERHVNYKT